jgi:hypothetical protein
MATGTSWEPLTPEQKYGWRPPSVAAGQPSVELSAVPSPAVNAAHEAAPWHPDNPLFWFGVLGAATFGLMAFSTSVRVGKATAVVAVGSTK